ncbi:MAG: hypothetical protein Q7K55_01655 [Candidatus Levybacteria bacterium]|nr:hypothetical protein [Candidatus Levybacteria bacterium]
MKITKNTDGSISADIKVQDIKDILGIIPWSPIRNFLKRNKEDKIGIIIGITTEKEDEKNRVDNDLIKGVNNFLNANNLVGLFKIKSLDEEESKNIDNQNWLKVLEKYKSHLIIYGHVSKRNAEKEYSLKLEAGVRHRPIPLIVSNILSSEFANLFPRQRFIPVTNDLLGFEITAKEIALVTQYMVGVALFMSGYLGFSFQVLSSLNDKIGSILSENIQILVPLKQKTQDRIVDISKSICFFLYGLYSLKRNIEFIRDSKSYIDIINRDRSSEKSVKHLESMYYFLIDNNVDKAIAALCSFDDPLKPYNLAFLHFFKNDFNQGMRYYKKAFKRDISGRTKNDLEIFISDTLEKYPEKYQLLFARALINYKCRGDFRLALDDFKDFIDKACSEDKYVELNRLSLIYIKEINRKN